MPRSPSFRIIVDMAIHEPSRRRAGTAAVAFALAIAMLGTTLPTPLYDL
jgi:hypothetical protein